MKASVTFHIAKAKAPVQPSEESLAVLKALKTLLKRYVPPLSVRMNEEAHFEVWTAREIVLKRKKRKNGVMFASLIAFKDYVGFYLQPLYFNPELIALTDEELAQLKRGVTCFHISQITPELLLKVDLLVAEGLEYYRANKWL